VFLKILYLKAKNVDILSNYDSSISSNLIRYIL